MLTAAIDWTKIENFVGFGSPTAPIIFVGMEEGLLDEDKLDADLRARSEYAEYEDLYAAQCGLDGASRYFGATPKNQPTWRPMCHLMLRLNGVERPTREQRLRYMADNLGRAAGQTLLSELLPYPRKRTGDGWPYRAYGRYQSYAEYREALLGPRLHLLSEQFAQVPRSAIVCYGKGDWIAFSEIFNGAEWSTAATFRLGRWRDAAVVLCPHFATRAFNSDAQLNAFADMVIASLTPTASARLRLG